MVKETRIATAIHYTHQNIGVEAHQFSTLAQQGHWLTPVQLDQLRQQTGLADLSWRTLYYKFPDRAKTLAQALADAEGYVFFLHGWDGTHRIWEDLPLRLTVAHQRLVCFNFDVNRVVP